MIEHKPYDGEPAEACGSPHDRDGPAEMGASFYERAYSGEAGQAERGGAWRALGARGKVDHVIELCRRARLSPESTLDVGCGDGAVLSELHRRGFGGRLSGVEISEAAVRVARERREIDAVETYDGAHLPAGDGSYELGILSHVLEHVGTPAALLAEVGRVCGAVVIEVPLESNLSALRRSRRGRSEEVGHLQRLSRASARAIVAEAGMRVACELEDPLPLTVHVHFTHTPTARLGATARWALRSALHRTLPALARRAFTVHYAALCLPQDG